MVKTGSMKIRTLTTSNIGNEVVNTPLLAKLGKKPRPVSLNLNIGSLHQSRNLIGLTKVIQK